MFIVLICVRLVVLVCAIIVLIRQFKNAGLLHGIIGILTCTIWTFIWGWMNAVKLRLRSVMALWTILFVVYVWLGSVYGFSLGLGWLNSH